MAQHVSALTKEEMNIFIRLKDQGEPTCVQIFESYIRSRDINQFEKYVKVFFQRARLAHGAASGAVSNNAISRHNIGSVDDGIDESIQDLSQQLGKPPSAQNQMPVPPGLSMSYGAPMQPVGASNDLFGAFPLTNHQNNPVLSHYPPKQPLGPHGAFPMPMNDYQYPQQHPQQHLQQQYPQQIPHQLQQQQKQQHHLFEQMQMNQQYQNTMQQRLPVRQQLDVNVSVNSNVGRDLSPSSRRQSAVDQEADGLSEKLKKTSISDTSESSSRKSEGISELDSNEKDKEKEKSKKANKARHMRRLIGNLTISMSRKGSAVEDRVVEVRPSQQMFIQWTLPQKYFNDNPDANLCIALLRFGSYANATNIVTKNLGRISTSMSSRGAMSHGEVPFLAPKGCGEFIYRIFDQGNNMERSHFTLAVSRPFVVTFTDREIPPGLKFTLEALSDKKIAAHRSAMQLNTALKCTRMTPRMDPQTLNDMFKQLTNCLEKVFQFIASSRQILDTFAESGVGTKKAIEDALKTHHEAFNVLTTIIDQKLFPRFDNQTQEAIRNHLESYCSIQGRFFASAEEMTEAQNKKFDFQVRNSNVFNNIVSKENLQGLEASMLQLFPKLLPSEDFNQIREAVRRKIKTILYENKLISDEAEVLMFGSSRNNFGNDGADLDMCLVFPPGQEVDAEERAGLIEKIAEVLGKDGQFSNVKGIPTARIPVVTFVDPDSGLDCDITFINSLALFNTEMLRVYSHIDTRLRILAYIIKHWAKNRHINTASEGTLCSYGYILCLIYFLQRRRVLPFLQRIPQSWNGGPLPPPDVPQEAIGYNYVRHPFEDTTCNVYFYKPNNDTIRILRAISDMNKESVAFLLCEFFNFFAWKFDYENQFVRISRETAPAKPDKCETDGWNSGNKLSIEDPFETHYDVAHVIKKNQMNHIRMEFVRAYSLCCEHLESGDSSQLLEALCREAPTPSFAKASAEEETNSPDDDN